MFRWYTAITSTVLFLMLGFVGAGSSQANAESSPTPDRQLSGISTGLSKPTGVAFDSTGRMYVSNRLDNSVTVYAAGWASGPTAPIKTLKGASTRLAAPRGLAFDSAGLMYVVTSDSVLVFASNWVGGDTAPVKVLRGANTGLVDPRGVAFDSAGRMYIVNSYETQSYASGQKVGSITVYSANWASGDTRPIAELSGPNTLLDRPYGMAFDALGRTYVANNDSITVYTYSWAGGDLSPTSRLVGSATSLARPMAVLFDENGIMYVANAGNSTITTYDADWISANTAPLSILSGGRTQLAGPADMALDDGGRLFVANEGADKITAYSPRGLTVLLTVAGEIPLRSYMPTILPINVELRASPVSVTARTSDAASPTRVTSLTPSVCEVDGDGGPTAVLLLRRTGTCTTKSEIGVQGAWDVAPTLVRSFYVVQSVQTLSVAAVQDVRLSSKWTTVRATASSGLPVTLYSTSPAICMPSFSFGSRVRLLTPGQCSLVAVQPGNTQWQAISTSLSFQVLGDDPPKVALRASCSKAQSAAGTFVRCQGTSEGIPVGTQLSAFTRPSASASWAPTSGTGVPRVGGAGDFSWAIKVGAQRSMSVYFAWNDTRSTPVTVKIR